MPSTLVHEHCTIESSDGLIQIADGRFSVNGESPHATCAYGGYNPPARGSNSDWGRARVDDRILDCEVKELDNGGYLVTGAQRLAMVRKGVSKAEALVTLRVTPGINRAMLEEQLSAGMDR